MARPHSCRKTTKIQVRIFKPFSKCSLTLQPARLAFEAQRNFIANVSHELGTPLALLRANADLLLLHRERLTEEDRELLEDIVTETTYMDRMTTNMLLLTRIDRGQLHLQRELLDLGQLTADIVKRTQPLANQANITLTAQQEEAAYTHGDRTLLEQVTLILLSNALKYTPTGGRVTIATFTRDNHACLCVRDTGIGIAPEHIQHLGERFYRVDKARSRAAGGNGLGLSIARAILSTHHGALHLSSTPGHGTEATILLPAAQQEM